MKENIPVLEIKNVSKSFPGVKALQNVSLTAYKGECLALIGENGAGKSTLMKILSGAYYMDEGEIYIDGRKVEIHNPADGQKAGAESFIRNCPWSVSLPQWKISSLADGRQAEAVS